jgi:thiamine-phosphate diphosphorylase
VVVNDRLDVALAAGAHGVHLKSSSYPPARVRAITPAGFLVGRSIHSAQDAIGLSATVDYVIFGTVFPSSSKPGRTPVGPAALAEAVLATPIPVLAIGGVSAETAELVAEAGAAGIAGIGLFATCATTALPAVVGTLTRAFDGS